MMRAATLAEVEAACMDRSASEAVRHLLTQDLATSESRCNVVIGRLIAAGRRERKPNTDFSGHAPRIPGTADAHARACKRLLARQLQTGAHWISDPAKMAAALREAGLVA